MTTKNKSYSQGGIPMILVILDGWGVAKPNRGNAITLAKTPVYDSLKKKYPYTEIKAHGKYVGLPENQDGNSEAGHGNIGAGRILEQDALKISKGITDGTFFKNPAFQQAVKHVQTNNSQIHLMGMLSNGMSAHSDPGHIVALLTLLRNSQIEKINLHLFTDGRDSPKYASLKLVENIEHLLKKNEKIATVMGRFYAMDRKKKWERTNQAFEALVLGKGRQAKSATAAITESYIKGENDEFIEPYVIKQNDKITSRIEDNDGIIFFNLRSDRARQLTKIFVQKEFNKLNPGSIKRAKVLKNLCFVVMTDFGPDLDAIITAFPSPNLKGTLPFALASIKQLYIAEAEKYAHVTYFFNGGYAGKVNGEDFIRIKSPDVRSYDATPAMKTKELADIVIKCKYDFTALNIAAPDMIGHTGNLEAGIKCAQAIDKEISKIVKVYLKKNGTIIITADHGNLEEMINLETGEIDTEHSSCPVPFMIINKNLKDKIKLKDNGVLGDIAPTILELLDIKKPREMTGRSLIK